MTIKADCAVEQAFSHTASNNPLRELSSKDRAYVWAELRLYASARKELFDKEDTPSEALNSLSSIASDALSLAQRISADLLHGPYKETLGEISARYEDLPGRLSLLSFQLQTLMNAVGRRGHYNKQLANRTLVRVSEFINIKCGSYYDEHLSELFQAVADGVLNISEDVSGDSFRKKRKQLQDQYPNVYHFELERAKRFADVSGDSFLIRETKSIQSPTVRSKNEGNSVHAL